MRDAVAGGGGGDMVVREARCCSRHDERVFEEGSYWPPGEASVYAHATLRAMQIEPSTRPVLHMSASPRMHMT